MNNEDYIVIQGWMVNELQLKGLEKELYAIIYGFTRSGQGKFNGSLQYLCNWTSASKQGIKKALDSLVSKGLIIKNDLVINGVNLVEYYTTEFNGGIQLSCTNNIYNNKREMYNIESNNINSNNNTENILLSSNYTCKEKKFKKPTLDEVKEYIKCMKYTFSANRFYDYYESNGWMVGKNNHMKDWKAACRLWNSKCDNNSSYDKPNEVEEYQYGRKI